MYLPVTHEELVHTEDMYQKNKLQKQGSRDEWRGEGGKRKQMKKGTKMCLCVCTDFPEGMLPLTKIFFSNHKKPNKDLSLKLSCQ